MVLGYSILVYTGSHFIYPPEQMNYVILLRKKLNSKYIHNMSVKMPVPRGADSVRFQGRETINQIEIVVEWDEHENEYILYLPGMDATRQTMGLGDDKKHAEEVFGIAKTYAGYDGTTVGKLHEALEDEVERVWESE